jgi:hypothetical protein
MHKAIQICVSQTFLGGAVEALEFEVLLQEPEEEQLVSAVRGVSGVVTIPMQAG